MHRTAALAMALILGSSLAGVGTRAVAQQPPPAAPPAPGQQAPPPGERPQQQMRARHPQILAAGRALRQAATHLERAAHDYGGHRAKALELVKQAEQELREAIEYARAHQGETPGTR